MGSTRRSPTRWVTVRRALITAGAVICLAAAAAVYRTPEPGASDPPSVSPPTAVAPSTLPTVDSSYVVSVQELYEVARRADTGEEPHASAVDQLIEAADDALERSPRPVDPLSPRGGRYLVDTKAAYTLALAWVVTDDDRYATAAREFIMDWVDQVDEVRATCPDRGGSTCATSLLVSRTTPAFVFAAQLLEGSGVIREGDRDRLMQWLEELILPAASQRSNNWGDAGTFMRLVVTDYLGDAAGFEAALDHWRALMDLVTADGQIPEETRRGRLGLLYTQGAISYKVASAVIAERRGINLWSYEGEQGGTLAAAVETLARYWLDPDSWPWHDGRLHIPSIDPVWEMIYRRWPEPEYARIFAPARPLGADNPSAIIWTTLTHGLPLEESVSTEAP